MTELDLMTDPAGAPSAPKLKHCPRLGYKVAPSLCEEQRELYSRACERFCGKAETPKTEESPTMKNGSPKPDYRVMPAGAPPLGPGMVITKTGRVRRGHGYWRLCPGCQKAWIIERSNLCPACAGAQRRGKHYGGSVPGRPHKRYPKSPAPHFNDPSERAGATVAALAGTSTFPRTQPGFYKCEMPDLINKPSAATFPDAMLTQPFSPVQAAIMAECDALAQMLIEKNRAYGNSALDPVRVFSKADAAEQIKVRLDDKISRLMRGQAAGEDVILDLLGYLILLRVHTRLERDRKAEAQP
jgi:hypothetical protein